jgi:transcriptional regulator with XRE-family HTH domain
MSINNICGSRIKFLREKKNEMQGELADLLKICRTAVCRYEMGNRVPDYSTLIILAQHFNVSIDYLLGVTDIPDIQPLPGAIDAVKQPSVKMFVPSNIDLICGSLGYEETAKNMSLKMGNPLYQTVFNSDYLEALANGKIPATHRTIELLATYALVDPSFFYRNNTIEDLENAKMEYIKNVTLSISNDILDNELKTFVFQSNNVKYLKLAMSLKGLNIDPEKLTLIIENLFKNTDGWKYVEFAQDIKNKGIDPNEIIGYSLKYSK